MPIFKCALVIVSAAILSACSMYRFVDKPIGDIEALNCPLNQDQCGFTEEGKYLIYTVKALGGNTYEVDGKVSYDWSSIETDRWIDFYVLFVDSDTVVHEHRVRTMSVKSGFNFTVTTDRPISSTALAKMMLWTRS